MRPAIPLTLLTIAFTAACGGTAFWDPWPPATDDDSYDDGAGGATTVSTDNAASSADSSSSSSNGGSSATTSTGGGSTGGAPTSVGLTEMDLGTIASDQQIPFEVPSNTLGFSAIVTAPGDFETLGVKSLVSPNQQKVVDNHSIDGTSWVFAWFGTTVAAVPQSDAASAMPEVMSGTWSITLGNPYLSTASGHLSIWLRQTDDGAFHGGVLDINVFLVEGVSSELYIEGFLEGAFLDYAGLGLGDVEFFTLGQEWGVLDGQGVLEVLEQTSMASTSPALNMVVVSDLTGDLEDAAGVAAGIPGQGIEHGTHASGVVMEILGDPQLDALVVRHEAGHLAGLFHTTEISPGYGDALSDTAKCSDVEALLFDCPDAVNIMFPVAGTYANQFSGMQKRVIHGSTQYRGYANAAEAGANQAVQARSQRGGGLRAQTAVWSGWEDTVSRRARELMQSIWCADGRGVPFDPYRTLEHLGVDARALLTIGSNPSAPSYLRKRALRGIARMNPSAEQLDAVAAIARDIAQPRAVRMGALHGLRSDPMRSRDIARSLDGDGDAMVRQLATHLR